MVTIYSRGLHNLIEGIVWITPPESMATIFYPDEWEMLIRIKAQEESC